MSAAVSSSDTGPTSDPGSPTGTDASSGLDPGAAASPGPGPRRVRCREEPFVRYIPAGRIAGRTRRMGEVLSEDYADRRPIFVGVLNGAFVFLADLLRTVSVDCEVDFLKLSSYGAEKVSRGEVTELKRVDADLADRHVVLVEDIVDTGLTLRYLVDLLRAHGPRSLRTVTLLHKPDARDHEVPLDYVGFDVPDRFVIGYGMDYGQTGRNWPAIYVREREDPPPEPVAPPLVSGPGE